MRKAILIVEDEPGIAELFSEVLTEEGYQVGVAVDGEEGLRRVQQDRPDLVLSNIMMPRLTGADMARAIRADHALDRIPIILMSAAERRLDGTPCDAFFEKPFTIDALLDAISRLLTSPRAMGHFT